MPKSPQVVVVTGASAGIGRATARLFASRGADVGLIARGSDGLKAAQAEIEDMGRRALVLNADVANFDEVSAAAAAVEEELGPIDVWVNNAMVSVFASVEDTKPEDFRRVTDVTYHGYVYGTLAALRYMRPRNSGCIVQVGSTLAYRGIPLQAAYCGAKHAIQGFNESLRCELLHDRSKVRLTMVQMPAVNTPQFHWVKTDFKMHPQPVPPIYQPELAAEAVVWASEHRRREVNLGFPTSLSIVANNFVPGLLDHYLARKGLSSQKASWPIEPDRPDNLWEPVPGDHGAHGEFDSVAHESTVQWWMVKNRPWLLGAAAVTGAAAWFGRR
ncbi:MAG TPA: SDR family oxidoreductase [Actinomycetota bacterium]|jgi:short-subunit dehydrogenase|nr:SDR family oxidoreductase [Actinomycetota bacterium]